MGIQKSMFAINFSMYHSHKEMNTSRINYHVISSKAAAIAGSKPPSQCSCQLTALRSQKEKGKSIKHCAPLQIYLIQKIKFPCKEQNKSPSEKQK